MNPSASNKDVKVRTLVDVLQVAQDSPFGLTIIQGKEEEIYIPYRELFQSALHLLGYLQEQGITPGDELVFQLPQIKDFLTAF